MASLTRIHQYPNLQKLARKKKSNLSEKEVFDRVLAVLVSLRENNRGKIPPHFVEVKLSKENGLDIFSRGEVLTALERVNSVSYTMGLPHVLTLPESNYVAKDLKEITEIGDGKFHAKADLLPASEKHPLHVSFSHNFDSWNALYKYRRELTLEKLTPLNLEKIYRTVLAIEEQFQMALSQKMTIYAVHGSQTQDYTSRNNALEFLKQKNILTYESHFSGGVGWFDLVLDVALFLKFKEEIQKFWNAHYEREASSLTWPDDLKWEEITIRFHNGHEVTIEARDTKYKTDFKEMGFQSKKDNLPNQQWEFLKTLSESEGKMTWENPQADSSLKKKKQLLSAGLKAFFNIEEDSFEVYQQTKSYKAKFIVLPE